MENVEYNSRPAISCRTLFSSIRYDDDVIIILLPLFAAPAETSSVPIYRCLMIYNILIYIIILYTDPPTRSHPPPTRRRRPLLLCYITYPATTVQCTCTYICVIAVRWRHPCSAAHGEGVKLTEWKCFLPATTPTRERASDRARKHRRTITDFSAARGWSRVLPLYYLLLGTYKVTHCHVYLRYYHVF